ncbi:MAG: efflux RND transporter permease subunit [Capnocytophaga sp.]|nr:efflux RND transporter permease subunit [Capnocytophaga sp.]
MSDIKDKEFKLSSWAIDNKYTVYVMMVMFFIAGTMAYLNMPRESFPEIKDVKIYVSVAYPGNTAEDVERLIIDPLEDKLKGVSHLNKITSTSQEDYGMITLEFSEKIAIEAALQKVKDEVDKEVSNEDWPTFNGAKVEPSVFDITLSEFVPILNVNVIGNYPTAKLKEYAEELQDLIEDLPEIKEASIRGAQEKEVEVAVDMYKMMASKVSFDDVINAVNRGNVTMSAGNLISSDQRRTIRILGEIGTPSELEKFVVKSENGMVYLGDIATVSFKDKDRTTYAREFGESVVMLDVKKRAGENMIEASQKIRQLLDDNKDRFPSDLTLSVSNDQSDQTLNMVDDLSNNVIFGVILVVAVLMFFLGFRNALFVGFAIPMSMFMSFMIISGLGYTLNTMILFGLIMGLGMLVDNGIVVVENVYRLMEKEGMNRYDAAKAGIGEVAVPIIISTLTTVAAFLPLAMWPGMIGDFMMYLPLTLSIVLGSSLFVAIFFNSMLVSDFMDINEKILSVKQLIKISVILFLVGTFMLVVGGEMRGLGTVLYATIILFWLYKYFIKGFSDFFQRKILTWTEDMYERTLKFTLGGKNPYIMVISTFVLLVVSFVLFGMSVASGRTAINFFPDNKPNQIIVYVEYPQGTDIEKTNTVVKDIENRVYAILNDPKFFDGDYNFMVESAVGQVGEGSGNPYTDGASSAEMPNRGKITATLREFKYRRGYDSEELRGVVQQALKDVYPGLLISVEKNQDGPPAGNPINIELMGDDYSELITTAERMRDFIKSKNIPGIDELKVDVNKNKPAIDVQIDKAKAGELGVSTAQIANQLRRSVFGEKAGVYKEKGDDYDIYVRFNKDDRYNPNILFDQHIIFRDAATGQLKEVPVSSVASYKNTSSYSAIKHNKTNRVVTLYSALSPGYSDAAAIVRQIREDMKQFDVPPTVKIDYTGQIEEQNKQMAFLSTALLIAVGLIIFLLVYQFNSIVKPTLIFITILLSFTGVFFGLLITGQPFVIIMTMMGIISLAGVVVNNGVVLLDYTQLLIDRQKERMKLNVYDKISNEMIYDATVESGKARLRPVLLTAITTVLGLVPLATGFNINFFTLFSELDPQIYIGGDNVVFWGPLAWTVIYGLVFATFLTLIIVPVMFYLASKFFNRFGKVYTTDENGKTVLVGK